MKIASMGSLLFAGVVFSLLDMLWFVAINDKSKVQHLS